jgi:hypothetical protein
MKGIRSKREERIWKALGFLSRFMRHLARPRNHATSCDEQKISKNQTPGAHYII